MKKRYCALLMALLIVCCGTQAALAKPQFTNFKQWFGKHKAIGIFGSGLVDVTYYEFTVIDPNWEVANKTIFISFYDNKRKLIGWSTLAKKEFGIACSTVKYLADSGPKYDNDRFVKFSNDRYRVRGWLTGKQQIASYKIEWR
ncbi:MAG: hypothetical protein J5974_09230 [Pyramidobacter sp.]|nr:hypothetical protein [Pyramidobacter sp.]